MKRNERGIARSLIAHSSMCVDSGISDTKSQKVSCADAACGQPRSCSSLTACTRSGNFIASWMKKTGMLLPTRSQLPSSVYIFTANPRTSRARSGEPRLPATVENRTNASVFLPLAWKGAARVRSGIASRHSSVAWAL